MLERVYFLLRERVATEFGLFREPVPPVPKLCDFPDTKAFHEAQQTWQRGLCTLKRWTTVEHLDTYLTTGRNPWPEPNQKEGDPHGTE